MSTRANALAERLEQGARALAELARTLTQQEWNSRIPKDGRKVGVVVHHVASMYPIEIELAQLLAADRLRKETDSKAASIVGEADKKANALVTEAKKKSAAAP